MRYGSVGLCSGAAIGAGLMFMLDPIAGGRRRALLRDKAVRVSHKTADAVDATARDLGNRATGLAARTRRSLVQRDEADDDVIVARVRSVLGRVSSHPSALEVRAQDGHVTLTGPILAHEVSDVLAYVAGVRGVTSVDSNLEVHDSPGNIPALQGDTEPPGNSMWGPWSPTTQLLAGTAAAAIAAYALTRLRSGGNGETYAEM